jgi:type I restriction enzyme S subunit
MTQTSRAQRHDSGIPGLGSVPANWSITRMDKYLEYVKIQIPAEQLAAREVFHYSIPTVQETGSGAVEEGATISSDKLLVDREVVLVSKLNPRKATVCRAVPQPELTVCSTEFVPLAVRDMDIAFLFYMVSTDLYRQRLESLVESATRSHQRVTPADVYRFWWAMPPLPEQKRIVGFLDRETAKIDALIAKQEHLIATLREDRTATITHAVTKGLDPDVEMVESGDPTIPASPKHWTQKTQIKRLASVQTGLTLGKSVRPDEGVVVPYLRVANVQSVGVNLDEVKTVEVARADMPNYLLQVGDVLMTEGGDIDKLGRGCLWRGEVAPCIHTRTTSSRFDAAVGSTASSDPNR